MWDRLIFGYHLASRLAYVVGVGMALTKQERHQVFTRRDGVQQGFRNFRRIAARLMTNDGVSFVLLCVATRGTVQPAMDPMLLIVGGVVLVAVGVGTKLWAARALGAGAYYWHSFFAPGPIAPDPSGPYRFFRNPMYTIGYLQAYGLALILSSWPGLIASAFDQAAILAFYYLVEKPHIDRLTNDFARPYVSP